MPDSEAVELDIASTVLRIEQIIEERAAVCGEPSALFWLLVDRLESNARRLRGHISPGMALRMREAKE